MNKIIIQILFAVSLVSVQVMANNTENNKNKTAVVQTRMNAVQQKIEGLLSDAQREIEHSKTYLKGLDGNKGSLSRPHRYSIKQSLTEILDILEQEDAYDGQDNDEICMINDKLKAIYKSEKPDFMSWDDYDHKKRQKIEAVIDELRKTSLVARENRVFIDWYQDLVRRISTHLIGCLSHDVWVHRENLKNRYELVYDEKLEDQIAKEQIVEHDCFSALVPFHNNPVSISDVLKAYDRCQENVRKNWVAIEKDLKEKE